MIKSIGVKVVSSRVKIHAKYNYSKYVFMSQIFSCESGRTLKAIAIGLNPAHSAFW